MDYNNFLQQLELNNIQYKEDMLKKLENYYDYLIEYNNHTNLTTITNKEDVYLKHFFDSLIALKYYDFENKLILDMGSGAGLPAIVLAIFVPTAKFTLVESTGKKTVFLELLAKKLELNNISVVNQRAEELAKQADSKYDFVTARAVASLSILMELSARFLKINGCLIAYKTDPDLEIKDTLAAAKKLKLKLLTPIQYLLPVENSKRSLITFEKTHPTPKIYPRNYNQIKRNSL